jgi:LemA protein
MKLGVVAVVIILVLLIGAGMYVSVKNTLVQKNEAVNSTWSQVDVVLQGQAACVGRELPTTEVE